MSDFIAIFLVVVIVWGFFSGITAAIYLFISAFQNPWIGIAFAGVIPAMLIMAIVVLKMDTTDAP